MLRLVLITIALMTTSCSDAASNCSKEETLKLIGAGYTKAEISGLCSQAEKRESTDQKSSAVEGKLVDWNGTPVADVKIIASQVQRLKGYEQFEAVTDADGSYRIEGLYPSSHYVLKPWSRKWRSETAVRVESAPQGETAVLSSTMVISRAYAKNGSLVINLATGAMRFSVSDDGVISDSQTGLHWLVGPDQDTDYKSAEQWVAAISDTVGGNWRMPTRRELKSLYQKDVGERNMDPAFKTTGWHVKAEPYDSSSAWVFNFRDGGEFRSRRGRSSLSYRTRVFGVRSRPTQVSIVSYFQTCAPMHENHTCSVDEVSRLISAGTDIADINGNRTGNTPLRLAIINSLPIEFLNILIASGANVKANAQGSTLLNDLVNKYRYGFRDDGKEARKKIEILKNAGLDINTVDTHGYTALMTAVRGNNIALVKMIMEAGCDANIRNSKGQSAYDIVLEQLKENEKPVKPGTPKGIVEARKRINKDLKEMAILTRFNS